MAAEGGVGVCVWRNLQVRDDGEGRKIAATADSY